MKATRKWPGVVLHLLVAGCCFLWVESSGLRAQGTQTSQEEEKQNQKPPPDAPVKAETPGKQQTPEQTAARRKALEAKEKARMAAAAAAKTKAANKAKTQNANGEYVYTNSLIGSQAEQQASSPDNINNEAYWRGKKAALDKQIADTRENLKKMQETLLQKRLEYLREPSPLKQNEIQEQIVNLMQDIAHHESVLQKSDQMLQNLADEARQAGVPPGWVR